MTDGQKKVTIYTTDYCPYCKAAKKLLAQKNVDFEEIDVTDSTEKREHVVELSGGRTTVPQIFFGDKHIGGYDDLVAHYKSA